MRFSYKVQHGTISVSSSKPSITFLKSVDMTSYYVITYPPTASRLPTIKLLANVPLHEYVTAHTGVAAMPKSSTITLRVERELKADSEQIFRRLGLTTTEAIKIFLGAVRNRRGIPFPVQLDERRGEGAPITVDRKATLNAIMGKYAAITPSEEFARIKQEESGGERPEI